MVYKCMQNTIGPTHYVEVIEAQVDGTMATNRNERSDKLSPGGGASVASKRTPKVLGILMRPMVSKILLNVIGAVLSARPMYAKRANRPLRLCGIGQSAIAENIGKSRRLSNGFLRHWEIEEGCSCTHGLHILAGIHATQRCRHMHNGRSDLVWHRCPLVATTQDICVNQKIGDLLPPKGIIEVHP